MLNRVAEVEKTAGTMVIPVSARARPSTLPDRTTVTLLVLAALVALVPVMLSVRGAFKWHFRQATTVQGGIEVLLLWFALALAASLPRGRYVRAMLVAVISCLYLRRHHVDAPLVVALLYVEGLIAAGSLLLAVRAAPSDSAPMRDVAAFFLGMIACGLLIWIAAAMGFGRPFPLSLAALVLLSVIGAIVRRRPLVFRLAGLWLDPIRRRGETWLGAAILAWFLCLCARTNNVVDFDSLWYALRLPQVLVGEQSLFEPLGLVSPVYYFPKLYESLMLPLAAFGDFSFQICLTILVLGMAAIMADGFLRSAGLSGGYCLLGVATLITIPTFSNMALAAKPDLFAATLLLGAAVASWSVGRGADPRQLGWVLALVMLAACAKINTAPYGAAILLAGVVGRWLWKRRAVAGGAAASEPAFPPAAALLVVALAVPLALLVTARTWLLAGVPTIGPEQLVAIWKAMGMQIRPPAGTLDWTAPAEVAGIPRLVVDYLFRPARLEHIVITWVGNVWAILPVVGAALWLTGARDGRSPTWVWWPAILVGLWLALGTRFLVRGGDGNYFLLPLALATLLALAWIGRITPAGRPRKTLLWTLTAICIWQASYAFVSAAWSQPGTRTLDLDFARSPLDTQGTRDARLKEHGLIEIDVYLRAQDRTARVIGVWPADESGLHWLSARAEGLATVSYSHPQFVFDGGGLLAFLRLGKIDYLIVPMRGGAPSESELPAGVRALLAGFDWRKWIVAGGERFALIDVRAVPGS